MFRHSPEHLRLALKVCEREMRKQDCVMFIDVGDQGDGGCAPRALSGAGQRRLVYKVNHFVAAEAPQFILVALAATNHAWQVLEGVHAVLRAPPLTVLVMVLVTVMVIVALIVVEDQAVPAPLVAR